MSEHQPFEISAAAYTLKYNLQAPGKIILNGVTSFEIPIFQRPYSWTEEQIRKFTGDLLLSYRDSTGALIKEPMFIGTMQLSAPANGKHEVIDGQQRLTTLLILLKVLQYQYADPAKLPISFDWLTTKVNNGLQQQYLSDLLQADLSVSQETLNPYLNNAYLIRQLVREACNGADRGIIITDLDDFIAHLFQNIYFVVIETRAGLSKTLQIFNAINTTGLDLNGGDIFKLRMYEYLTSKQGYGEDAFAQISRLYEKIAQFNEPHKREVTTIDEILSFYQSILISTYNLPVVLYDYNPGTFFEKLFDTLFNITPWEHFRNNVTHLTLSLEDIDRLIDARIAWEGRHQDTAEDLCAVNFIWSSRYGRHWRLIIIFLYASGQDPLRFEKMFSLTRQLSKLYSLYSIRYAKGVNDIHRFTYGLIKDIIEKDFDGLMQKIKAKTGHLQLHNPQDLLYILNGDIVQNTKMKNLVCKISAMLSENYHSTDKGEISAIYDSLFEDPLDIEHIQAFHDHDSEKRPAVYLEWQDDLNGLGNLVVLEQKINRSIKNYPFISKRPAYLASKYASVKAILNEYELWDLASCRRRKAAEVNKLVNYLFN